MATGNSRPETGKSPPPSTKTPQNFRSYNTPKQAENELSEVSIPLVLQVFRGLHYAELQTATFFIIEQII